ncbi:hypothetical protein F5Y16DRAFT_236079 [Xylariaceae sp. FL0255]|nr:hypothetical protein F5Y16DRAFT_236079 [Xylariaceae sp. FL0255]
MASEKGASGSLIPRRPVPNASGSSASEPVESSGDDAGVEEPPPYSGPSSTHVRPPQPRETRRTGPRYYPGLPVLDYSKYSPPMFKLSADTTTISSKAAFLSENAKELAGVIRTLASVPPKPQVLIKGTRGRRVDFQLRLNMMNLLVPENPRQRLDYLRCVSRGEMALRGSSEPSLQPELPAGAADALEAWCAKYVADTSSVKMFTLERVVANLDTNWLEGQIRSLVASTSYKGVVTVDFPITHARVTVQNPDKVNAFFTGVASLFAGKAKYEVVKAVWPFATAKNGDISRKCIVQSEQTWWDEWRDPLKFAMSEKRKGWVTNEDKLESIMESKGKAVALVDWGPDEV